MTITIQKVHLVVLGIIAGVAIGSFFLGRATVNGSSSVATSIPGAPSAGTTAPTVTAHPSTTATPLPSTTTMVLSTTSLQTAVPPLPVFTAGNYSGRDPTAIDNSPGCCSVIDHLTWSSWTAAQAEGHGTYEYDTCVNGCVRGPFDPYPATVTLSAPEGGQYTALTEVVAAGPEAGFTSWTYPSHWPFGAS